jgi:hypothetical protein
MFNSMDTKTLYAKMIYKATSKRKFEIMENIINKTTGSEKITFLI